MPKIAKCKFPTAKHKWQFYVNSAAFKKNLFFLISCLEFKKYVYICTHKRQYNECFTKILSATNPAGVAKLVDVPDLGSGAARRVGSSPITRTKAQTYVWAFLCLFLEVSILIISFLAS
jgi:hypothetical protein